MSQPQIFESLEERRQSRFRNDNFIYIDSAEFNGTLGSILIMAMNKTWRYWKTTQILD